MVSDDDDCYKMYITEDEGVSNSDADSEKENNPRSSNTTSKRKRSSKKQLDKMIVCIKNNGEEMMSTEIWNNLADELNSIGPATYSVTKWKRVWSVYKYNSKKRKSSSGEVLPVPPSNSSGSQSIDVNMVLHRILEQFTRMNETLDDIGRQIDKMKNVLEEVSKVVSNLPLI